jgi:16S rRNA (guanine527-N7)-methyltransferase
VHFYLIDSIGKKIKVVNAVTESLELKNVNTGQVRAEQLKGKYDFIISRAVTGLPEFVGWVKDKISNKQQNAVPNGVIYLKGGNLDAEIHKYRKRVLVQDLSQWFDEDFFKTKKLVYLPLP